MTTGQRIKAARTKVGLTQKELGAKLGVSESFIAQYETDKRKPKKETLKKIAEALDVYYLDLYGDAESKEIAAYIQAGMKLGINAQIAEQQQDFLEPFRKRGYEFTEAEHQVVSLFNQLRGFTQQLVITDLARLCLDPKHRKDEKSSDGSPQDIPTEPSEGADTIPPPDAPEEPPEGE